MLDFDFGNEAHFFQKNYSSALRTDFIGIFNQLIHWAIGSRGLDVFLFSRTLEVETGNNDRV